jgi:hypothetical protein
MCVRGLGGSFPGWLHAYHTGNSISRAHEQIFQVVDDGTHYGIGKLVLGTQPSTQARRPGRNVSPERDRQRSPAGVRRSGRSLARAQSTRRRNEGARAWRTRRDGTHDKSMGRVWWSLPAETAAAGSGETAPARPAGDDGARQAIRGHGEGRMRRVRHDRNSGARSSFTDDGVLAARWDPAAGGKWRGRAGHAAAGPVRWGEARPSAPVLSAVARVGRGGEGVSGRRNRRGRLLRHGCRELGRLEKKTCLGRGSGTRAPVGSDGGDRTTRAHCTRWKRSGPAGAGERALPTAATGPRERARRGPNGGAGMLGQGGVAWGARQLGQAGRAGQEGERNSALFHFILPFSFPIRI